MKANAPNADPALQTPDSPLAQTGQDQSEQEQSEQEQSEQAERYEAEIQALKAELDQTRLAHQMAIEMAQFQAGFLARTSHELRSPINSVISLHQLILSDLCDSPAEERDFVAQAHAAAQKMLGLMDELIHVSQLVQNTARLHLAPASLQDILASVKQATQLQAKNRNLQLEIQLPDPSVMVLADERRLKQVLLHLVDMPLSVMQQGFVRVTTHILSETAQIEITDQRPAECWQELIDTLHNFEGTDQLSRMKGETKQAIDKESTLLALSRSPIPPSIGLRLLTQRSILELMGGQLMLLETPVISGERSANSQEGITRIRCVLPLATTL
ncbi:sensor histidine kinase [Leptolyngbya sp. GB1-A1]|uniref:sensor histidine kinase n=1 Tax=Leptolyngbya sp. GB1-A1 TaxID=2933908 RepID=UPI003299FB1B